MPSTPINDLIVQNGGIAQSGLLVGDGTAGPVREALAADVSAALDLISNTQGAILYRGATGWAALPPGTPGQKLTTNGAGADPSWT